MEKNNPNKVVLIKSYKNMMVKIQEYEIASELRSIEKRIDAGEVIPEKEIDTILENCSSRVTSSESTSIGDSYSIDEKTAFEANELIEKAHALRSEATKILELSSALNISAFELLRKSNPAIPKQKGLTFISETKTVVVID